MSVATVRSARAKAHGGSAARRHTGSSGRRGVALVAALALLVLGAALLAGSTVASVALRRSARTRVAAARARAEAVRGLALVLQGWDGSLDSMSVGARSDRALPSVPVAGLPVLHLVHVQRLSASLYAATVEVRVGDSAAVVATRRARLLLARAGAATDSGAAPAVAALARWCLVELP
jgi:hypothetical protein